MRDRRRVRRRTSDRNRGGWVRAADRAGMRRWLRQDAAGRRAADRDAAAADAAGPPAGCGGGPYVRPCSPEPKQRRRQRQHRGYG